MASERGFLRAIQRLSRPTQEQILQFERWNTPAVSNGWEQITKNPNYGRECFNLEPITDHMPQMGSLVGYAVTVTISPGTTGVDGSGRQKFRDHVATLPQSLPKIIVVQDKDKPIIYGSMWGEVNANFFRSLGVVGAIVDGGVRDISEMTAAGFHAMSRGVCVGHGFGGIPIEWDIPIEVFGTSVRPGQLIHADKHGFLVVPEEDEAQLLEATEFMDYMEVKHVIQPGKFGKGKTSKEINDEMRQAGDALNKEKTARYGTYQSRFQSKL